MKKIIWVFGQSAVGSIVENTKNGENVLDVSSDVNYNIIVTSVGRSMKWLKLVVRR